MAIDKIEFEVKEPLKIDTEPENGGDSVDICLGKVAANTQSIVDSGNALSQQVLGLDESVENVLKIDFNEYAKVSDIPVLASGNYIDITVGDDGWTNTIGVTLGIATEEKEGFISSQDKAFVNKWIENENAIISHVKGRRELHVSTGGLPGQILSKGATEEEPNVWIDNQSNASWGNISGNISEQSDLIASLAGKAPTVHSHTIQNVTGLDVALASKSNTVHTHDISSVNNLSTTLETITDDVEANRISIGAANETANLAKETAENAQSTADEAKSKADSSVQGLIAGDNITITAQGNNVFKIDSTGEGGGGIPIPASWGTINGDINTQADLKSALDGKSPTTHTHSYGMITGLQSQLDSKSSISHSHTITAVSGLETALNSKSDTGHSHSIADVGLLQSTLAGISEDTNAALTNASEALEAANEANNKVVLGIKVTGATAGSSVGVEVNNPGTYSVTIGGGASAGAANTSNNVVIGTNSVTSGSRTIAVGRGSQVKSGANDTVAIGYLATAESNARESVVIGSGAKSQGLQQVVIGYGAMAGGAGQGSNGAIAIGHTAAALGNRSVAIGATTAKENVFAVASDDVPEYYRRVVNMADGIDPNDAVTKQQLDLVSGLKCVANKIVPTLKWGEERLASINIPMTAAKFSQYVVLATGMIQAGGVQTELPIDAVYRNVTTPNGKQLVALTTTTTFITSDPEMEVAVFGYGAPKSDVYVFYNGSFVSVDTLEQAGGSLRITFKVFDTGMPITA